MLFQIDLTKAAPEQVFRQFWKGHGAQDATRAFAERLVLGVHGRQDELNRLIAASADNWKVDRMAVVDRNVLRMAIYELMHERETPAAVVIDEAIEVAKKFGSEKSGTFINGVLDSIRQRVDSAESGEST